MKKYIIIIVSFFCISLYSQEKYQPFIQEMKEVYTRNLPEFQRKAEEAMLKSPEIKDKIPKTGLLFIPELLLKKSKKLYLKIDSTNLVQYLDPRSMYFEQALVSINSIYIGKVESMYPKKEKYNRRPKTDYYIFEQIYNQLLEINPDITFYVQNVSYLLFIKENKLYALTWTRKEEGEFTVYPIDEYVEKFREDVFNVGFRYTPRVPYIEVR